MHKPPLQDVIVKPNSARRTMHESSTYGIDERTSIPRRPSQNAQPLERRRALPPVPPRQDNRDQYHEAHEPYSAYENENNKRGGQRWLYFALGIGAIVLVCSFALSLVFAGATVTVIPRQEQTTVNASFVAAAEPAAGELGFQQMTIERTAEKTVPASAEAQAEERSSGKITIYNDHSKGIQRLIKNTRFESKDGRIYRIRESVEVPGKVDATPGTIEVVVFAEEAGEDYNIEGEMEFTLPGLKGLPQEGKVYGKSKGAITGGFVGSRRTVAESDRNIAVEALKTELADQLREAAFSASEKPAGHHLYNGAIFFEYVTNEDRPGKENEVVISVTGRLHGVLFEANAFAQFLARQAIAGYDGNTVRIDNPDALTVTVRAGTGSDSSSTAGDEEEADETDKETRMAAMDESERALPTTNEGAATPWTQPKLNVEIAGNVKFIWQFDEVALRADLAGQQKTRMTDPKDTSILGRYPGIDRAEASVRPFWRSTFPEEVEDITVLTSLDS